MEIKNNKKKSRKVAGNLLMVLLDLCYFIYPKFIFCLGQLAAMGAIWTIKTFLLRICIIRKHLVAGKSLKSLNPENL